MVEPFRKRVLTDKELERAEKRIRDGQSIVSVCRMFRVGWSYLKRRIGDDRWVEMLAESRARRGLE